MKFYIAVSAALLLGAGAGATVSPTVSAGMTSAYQGASGFTTLTFDDDAVGSKPAGFVGPGAVLNGNLNNNYAAPLGDSTNYYAVAYDNSVAVPATDTFTPSALSGGYSYFGLYWGSIDPFNTITFMNGGSVVATFAPGTAGFLTDANGSLNASNSNEYVNFFFSGGQSFTSVSFGTSQRNFEFDNVTYGNAAAAVPEPASWALMVGGFGLMGAAMRRKKLYPDLA